MDAHDLLVWIHSFLVELDCAEERKKALDVIMEKLREYFRTKDECQK